MKEISLSFVRSFADVAQLVEHHHGKVGVVGSTPTIGSSMFKERHPEEINPTNHVYGRGEKTKETQQFVEQFNNVWAALKENFPILSEVEIENVRPTAEDFLAYTAGEFVPSNEVERAVIRVVLGSLEHLENLRERRATSLRMSAELLGIPFEAMSAELVRWFIVLHEVGHAYDYANNYQTEQEPVVTWDEQYEAQLQSLPVPGVDPVDLQLIIAETGGFDQYLATYPKVQKTCKKHNVTTSAELVALQEVAYRQMPVEAYADSFAADFMKKHAKEVGLSRA
jgi:hypothetical protein